MVERFRGPVWPWVVLVVFAFVAGFALLRPRPSDEELIGRALDESIRASREGRPGSVLDLLSPSLTVNEEGVPYRREIAEFVRKSRPDVEVRNRKPTISGDVATIESPVRVSSSLPAVPLEHTFERVVITLEKERTREWLVLPGRRWRVTKVTIPEFDVRGFAGD